MGQKLSPPLLNGTIPAFYSSDEGIVFTIPFSMNRAVSQNQVKGFRIKIKTIQSGNELYTTDINTFSASGIIEFTIGNALDIAKFRIGQYYKIQIAYIDKENTVGFFSSVGVAKYTSKPNVYINNLAQNILNGHIYSYQGIYSQKDGDFSERVYSYRFDLYNQSRELIDSSGELLHNSNNDNALDESFDEYVFAQELEKNQNYYIQYTVTTINGLTISSPRYRIIQKTSVNPELNVILHADLNYENGYVDLKLESVVAEGEIAELATGSFIVARASEDTNYTIWEEVHRFMLIAQVPSFALCKDFTIEQGKKYIYSIQQYNEMGLYSNRILSKTVYADFEHAFLYDGKRQLKIKYNPQISSFKKDLLESKVETIGSKHPFIFRNGQVYYTEFSIGGLISYFMDEECLFLSKEEFGFNENTISLERDNIAAERVFKMKVLEWLTNGEPKIFRSPTEGNFIVRLMNASLSPNDTLGRMLHTFQCTAYEIADFNYKTLGEMNFITIQDITLTSLQWETVPFFTRKADGTIEYKVNTPINRYPAHTIRITDMNPGDVVEIQFSGQGTEEIRIGVTGSYYIDTGVTIQSVKLKQASNGSMTYSYTYKQPNIFNTIYNINVEDTIGRQFIGEHDILKEILYVYDNNEAKWVRNPKLELTNIYFIKAEKRPLQRVIKDASFNKNNLDDPFLIYEIGTAENEYYSPNRFNQKFTLEEYYDGYSRTSLPEYQPYLYFNDDIISVNEKESAFYSKLDSSSLTTLKCGMGTFVTTAYQTTVIDYAIEHQDPVSSGHMLYNLQQAQNQYLTAKTLFERYMANINDNFDQAYANALRTTMKSKYVTYILELVKAQKEDQALRGELANNEN